ncbi:MAG: hypothetical protein IJ587_05985, partial [Synergistaceae bacterium]|nr:hypothetical protein [Synergistaceae bacterium]
IDKNVKMMTDEEIAAERAAEREKRAEKIKPATQQKTEAKETPAKESQTEAHAAGAKATPKSSSQQSESEPQKYEVLNGKEIRDRMKDYISSDSEMMKGLSPEGRAELEKRLNDPETAEEMKDKLFLSGEVNGQPMVHPLTSEESARLNSLQGAERDQYAAQLLQAQAQALESQVSTAKAQDQQMGYQYQTNENVAAVSRQSTKKDTDGATTRQQQPSLLLRILLMLLGIDTSLFTSESKQQERPAVAEQRQEAKQQQEVKNETVVHRDRSTGDRRDVTQAVEQHVKEVSNLRVEADGSQYKMTAIVDGKEESHEITEKDYNKFLALDDSQRLRLFNKTMGIPDGQSVRVADIESVKYAPKDEVLKIEINGRMNEVKDLKAQLDNDGKYRIWFTHSVDNYVVPTGVDITQEQYDNFHKMTPENRLEFMESVLADSLVKHGKTISTVNSRIENIQDNSLNRSEPMEMNTREQNQDHTDYTSMSTMNFDIAMDEGQQEQRSNGLRV